MDDTLQELENELKRLTPRAPSATLLTALGRDLGAVAPAAPVARRYATATPLRSWKWASWSMAGAAAAVALIFAVRFARETVEAPVAPTPTADLATESTVARSEPVAVAANRYEPVQATSVLYDLRESAPTTLSDHTEGREVRYRYVDTYTWKNPATNASLRWSVPRDEVRLVRASLD